MYLRIIRFIHRFFSDKCVRVVSEQHRAMVKHTEYKTPWWFNRLSKIEFKLRYMCKAKYKA